MFISMCILLWGDFLQKKNKMGLFLQKLNSETEKTNIRKERQLQYCKRNMFFLFNFWDELKMHRTQAKDITGMAQA